MKKIFEEDIPLLTNGARFLGSGGAGDNHLMQFLAIRAIRENGPVQLVSSFDVNEKEWVIPIGVMGSPTILSEKIMTGKELPDVIHEMERAKGIKAGAVIGLEIGGMNALIPIIAAALSKLPLIDGDGMGRAFSEIQMNTYHAFGIHAAPLVMANEQGRRCQIHHNSCVEVETRARKKVIEMGGWAAIACFPMQIGEAREVAIHHSFSLARRLGEALQFAIGNIHRVFTKMIGIFENSIYGRPFKLIEGKVVSIQRSVAGGLLCGTLVVEGTGVHITEQMEIMFQNEYLSVKQGELLLATVPDLICVMDADTGSPILIEDLENHMKVWVVSIPSPSLIRHPKMLEVVGPSRFGITHEFTPIEQLHQVTSEDESYAPLRD